MRKELRPKLGIAKLLLFSLYTLSITYYTFYGISKSYIEYFCTQERAGPIVFSQTFPISEIKVFSTGVERNNPNYLVTNDLRFSVHDKRDDSNITTFGSPFKQLRAGDFNDLSVVREENGHSSFLANYKIDEEYFKLKCTTGEWSNNNDCLELAPVDREPKLYYCNTTKSTFRCDFQKRLKTCNIKTTTQNRFFLWFLCLVSIFIIIFLLSVFNVKNYWILRSILKIEGVFSGFREKVQFCNPLTGKSSWVGHGEKMSVLSADPQSQFEGCKGVNLLKDKKGTYQLTNEGVIINIGEDFEYLQLSQGQIKTLACYFNMIYKDPNLCVCDGRTHYLTTKEVIVAIKNGKSIKQTVNDGEGKYINDVFSKDIEFVNKMFNHDTEIIKIMIEHNQIFFKSFLFEPLRLCLEGKSGYFQRPSIVKNSAWKWYTSDFKQLVKEKLNLNIHAQNLWKKSPALLKAMNEPINVIKAPPLRLKITNEHKYDVGISTKLKHCNEFMDEIDATRWKLEDPLLFNNNHGVDQFVFEYKGLNEESSFKGPYENNTPFVYRSHIPIFVKHKNFDSCIGEMKSLIVEGRNKLRALDEKMSPYLDAVKSRAEVVGTEVIKIRKTKEEGKRSKKVLEMCKTPFIDDRSDNDDIVAEAKEMRRRYLSKGFKELEQNVKYRFVKPKGKVVVPEGTLQSKATINKMLKDQLKLENYYSCLMDLDKDSTEPPKIENICQTRTFVEKEVLKVFRKRGKYKKPIKGNYKKMKLQTRFPVKDRFKSCFNLAFGELNQKNVDSFQKGDLQIENKKVFSSFKKCMHTLRNSIGKVKRKSDENINQLLDKSVEDVVVDSNALEQYPRFKELYSIVDGSYFS